MHKTKKIIKNVRVFIKLIVIPVLLLFQSISCILIFLLVPARWFRKTFYPDNFFSLWAGNPIINMAVNAKAERLLGVNAKSLVYKTYYITDSFDYNLSKWFSFPIFGKTIIYIIFIWACLFVDRIHFYCDQGLLFPLDPYNQFKFNGFELFIYKLLNIDIFFWTYGADVRSRDITIMLGEPNCCTECSLVGEACICNGEKQRKYFSKLQKFSKAHFSMGDMIEYTPGSINNLFFWSIDLYNDCSNKYKHSYPENDTDSPIRIVHATNHRMFKGTHFLIEAVKNLKAKGVPVELHLVEKIPNEKALDIYRSADIIFDQCLVGFHGYFALEAMALGKAVMCFIRKPEQYLLHPDECPIINTNVSTLENDIYRLAKNKKELRDIGIKGRKYIENYFTLGAFSERLKKAYRELGVRQ